MSTIYKIVNFVNTTLASPITSTTATTAVLSSSANLPTLTGGAVFALILNDAATQQVYEILYVTAITGATCTVLRGQEGTAATTWLANDFAFGAATAAELSNYAIANVAGAIAIDTSSTTQTKAGLLNLTVGAISGAFSGGLIANGDIGVARSSTTGMIEFGSSSNTLDFGLNTAGSFAFNHGLNVNGQIGGAGIFSTALGSFSGPTGYSSGDLVAQRTANTGVLALGGATGGSVTDYNIINSGALSFRTTSATYIQCYGLAFTPISDARLKDNVADISYGLKTVKALSAHSFDWIDGGKHDLGFIAQEVQMIIPELVSTDNEGFHGLNYSGIIPVLVKAIQELAAEVDALQQAA